MSLIAWIVVPIWILFGVVFFHLYSKSHTKTTEDEIHILEEENAPEGDEYRVMVAVSNPRNAVQMVHTTRELCQAKKARIELIHMVQVPEHIPLIDADRYMMEGKEAIVEAMLYLQPRFSFGSTIRYCRNVARGILNAVREKKINMLILGWHGVPKGHSFHLGSTIDPIIERSPCHVVMLKDGSSHQYQRILVPTAGGPNGSLALEVANILAMKDKGEICLFMVKKDHRGFDLSNFLLDQQRRLGIPKKRVFSKIVQESNIVDAILRESENHDLIVIGSTRKPLIFKVAKESIPEIVARKSKSPLIMVKAAEGIESLIKRII